jgi:iron complex transport system substrate-binding protein
MRVVSLVPGATDTIEALGLHDRLVGTSHRCEPRERAGEMPRVTVEEAPEGPGAPPRVRLAQRALTVLAPDLVITHVDGEPFGCGVDAAQLEAVLAALPRRPRVLALAASTVEEVLATVREIARALRVPDAGTELVARLRRRIDAVRNRSARLVDPPRVALLDGLDPARAPGAWLPELVTFAGAHDVLGRPGAAARTLDWDTVVRAAPELLVAAGHGMTVQQTMAALSRLGGNARWREIPAVRSGHVCVLDGARFLERPGPRLVDGLEILANTLHPETFDLPLGLPGAVVPANFAFLRMAASSRRDG